MVKVVENIIYFLDKKGKKEIAYLALKSSQNTSLLDKVQKELENTRKELEELGASAEVRGFNKEESAEVFVSLREIEGLEDFFRAILRGDKERYFKTENVETQRFIKGQYSRVLYFLYQMRKANEEGKVDTKVAGRYG